MNRIFTDRLTNQNSANMNPLHRPARRLRQETEGTLREVAYVLQLTRRVKEQILSENEDAVGV